MCGPVHRSGPPLAATMTQTTPLTPPTHVIRQLGAEHRFVDGHSEVRLATSEHMLVPGTGLLRMGVLAIAVDLAAGQPPTGAVTPTTDLSVRVARLAPMDRLTVTATVLKAGATLFVAECLLRADQEAEPFATGLATFMNRPVPAQERPDGPAVALDRPLHERIGARPVRPGVVELAPSEDMANVHHGTVQGGVLSFLGELAAATLFGETEPHLVADLDIRFLNRVKTGPLRATARRVTGGPGGQVVPVEIVDVGAGRLVAYVSTACVPVRGPG